MRPLGVPPTVNQLSQQCTTDFLKTVAERCNMYSGTTNPTVSQIPNKQWVVFKNTTNGEVRLWTNDNGVLKSTLLTTNTTIPAFSAFKSTTLTLANSVSTKIVFDTVDFDTTGGYSSSLGRWTPGVAGYYNISSVISLSNGQSTGASNSVEIWKNGSVFMRGGQFNDITATIADTIFTGRLVLTATDYIEVFVTVSSGSVATPFVNGAAAPNRFSHFSGELIRPL